MRTSILLKADHLDSRPGAWPVIGSKESPMSTTFLPRYLIHELARMFRRRENIPNFVCVGTDLANLSSHTRILFSDAATNSVRPSSRSWIDSTCSAGAQERVGIFCVEKKSSKIRMLLDARRTNQRFCQPAGVALATAETLSRIEVRLLDGVMAWNLVRFFEEMCRPPGQSGC